MARRRNGRRGTGSAWGRGLRVGAGGLLGLVGLAAGAFGVNLQLSKPVLEGTVSVRGLTSAVTVARDDHGVPVLDGASRLDLARALGFLHGQERFFQMDLIRRSAAGELSGLLGPIQVVKDVDRQRRLHRFRHRARIVLDGLPSDQRSLLEAYADGVNQGLAALGGRPFEYTLLLSTPQPWRAEDSALAAFAMYIDLQDRDGIDDRVRARAVEALGPDLAAFLFPRGTPLDSALDGTSMPEPPMPEGMVKPAPAQKADIGTQGDEVTLGSNAWAVGGALTGTGAALIANDMHLGISVPGTWYRARLRLSGDNPMDVTGVTLPGTPLVVAGSNGKVAWGYTNSYIDTVDAVLLEPVEGAPDQYRTPDGPKPIEKVTEQICPHFADCEPMVVEETIWGPVVEKRADGTRIAMRWTAHDADAMNLTGMMGMETAASVPDAIALAHQARQPQQNFVVGDAAGNVAWTIIGAVPARFGMDGQQPSSWADGTRGWNGMLPPDQIPVIANPEDGRIWTANARIVGGDAYAKLGDGGYDMGARQGQIRDALFARDRFEPRDMLAIQLDDRATVLDFWQGQLLTALEARKADPAFAAWLPLVSDWGGRAVPDSIGYRLVRSFRVTTMQKLYTAYLGPTPRHRAASQQEAALRRLLTDRPPGLVPGGAKDWDAVLDTILADLKKQVEEVGGIDSFTWGQRNVAAVQHPLVKILPPVAWLTDPPEQAVPGDNLMPRAQAPGFGASERFAVSPGHEGDGYFHMPGSQSAHPLSPYYLAGHQDWLKGNPTPFLPGAARWTLSLSPGN